MTTVAGLHEIFKEVSREYGSSFTEHITQTAVCAYTKMETLLEVSGWERQHLNMMIIIHQMYS